MSKVYKVMLTESAVFTIKADNAKQVNDWMLQHSINDAVEQSKRIEREYDEKILCEVNSDDADFDIHTETEAVECCPWCEGENVYKNWNVKRDGYVVTCQHCGKQIFLCDECLHAEDNTQQKCDWKETDCGGKCFRGETRNKTLESFLYKGKKFYKKDLYIPEFGYRCIGTEDLNIEFEASGFQGTDRALDEQFFFYVPKHILLKPDEEVVKYVVENLF